jgi:hypothetical protein
MLGFLGKLLLFFLAALLALTAGAWYVLDDPNALKPQLTEFIEAQTGIPVRIDGDLSWQLYPPLTLSAQQITAEQDGAQYTLAQLDLDVDLVSVITNQDLNAWQIRSLALTDLLMSSASETTSVPSLTLNNFAFDQRSPFATVLNYSGPDGQTIPLNATGNILYSPASETIELTNTRFSTDLASGLCDLQGTITDAQGYVDAADSIIPVSIWRGYDWSGDCVLDAIELEGQRFDNVQLELANSSGNSTTLLQIPQFFGGTASAKVDINAQHEPVVWRIEPDLKNVDSQALMTWLDQRLTWAAPLAYGGAITLTGNTAEELARSVRGRTSFNGGKGTIDISQIKAPLLNLAALIQEDQQIRNWPEMWQYERLTGQWDVDGTRHAIDLALDNLTAAIAGTYDPISDAMDMQIEVMFEDNPDLHSFEMTPLLLNLPIPLHCRGTLEAPKCAVDPAAAQKIVAQVLAAGEGSELRSKLEAKIDQDVPEEYREAAKNLLDIFSRGAQSQPQPDS